ncbi:hypothetical protein JTE90_024560 [Oedothorax gibbosus]|uniref:Gustatory receptor n=1 Tax=Oedothorax gibbosus TaxID=931172 RepID=A0AAV6VDY1_9ARAC|nr:hypothetical protein JTE90_024560 [Oedothorax gibbosus]
MAVSEYHLINSKITYLLTNVLFSLHGFPIPNIEKSATWRNSFRCLRCFSIGFVNFYLGYRIYKFVIQMNLTYDTFPLINAAVSAGIVDSVAIYSHKFSTFSKRIFGILTKRQLFLSYGAIFRLFTFYSMFGLYVLACSIIFPMHANQWFDAAKRNDSEPDWFHKETIRPCSHILIFVVCSGTVTTHLMLYCLVCCLLQRVLVSLQEDLRSSIKSKEFLKEFRSSFIQVADLVRSSDNIFSLIGLVGLASVLFRACSCIHFYLNLRSSFRDSWFFLLVQVAFDFCGLSALSVFGATVAEEGKKIAPALFRCCHGVSTRNTDFYIQCLAVGKMVMSSEMSLSAWKLFPFTRKVLPTVLGATISYIAVILQMHYAASSEVFRFNEKSTASNSSMG